MKLGRFCQFHKQPGHNTDVCRHLKSVIVGLIQKNHLQQYVQDHKSYPNSPQTRGNTPLKEKGLNQSKEDAHQEDQSLMSQQWSIKLELSLLCFTPLVLSYY